MKIHTEPARMSKRQKAYYERGRSVGYVQGIEAAPRMDDELKQREIERLKKQVEIERRALEMAQRDLAFANDRIEQLQNSVVIIRDGKK